MRRSVALAALIGWATSVGAANPYPNVGNWLPTGPFKLSPAKNRCIAASTFTNEGRKLTVALEARPAGQSYEIRLYVRGILRRWDDGKFKLGATKLESDVVVARPGNQAGTIIYRLGANRAELNSAGESPDLTMREISGPGAISISGLGSAVQLVDACAADLLERWGYSNEMHRGLATFPKAKKDWASYVSSHDYPLAAIRSVAGGETHALIDVGPDGSGRNCRIIQSSGNDELDRMSCNVVTERARYDPGQTAKGEPVGSPLYLVFRWEIPRPW